MSPNKLQKRMKKKTVIKNGMYFGPSRSPRFGYGDVVADKYGDGFNRIGKARGYESASFCGNDEGENE